MNSEPGVPPEDEMLPEYSLKGAVRGKYAQRHAEGTTLVPLDADVLAVFRTQRR